VILQEGDWLAIYTDGVVEAMNQRNDEYGEQRLVQVLNAGAASTPDEMLRRVMNDVDAFVGVTPQHDDITCLLVKSRLPAKTIHPEKTLSSLSSGVAASLCAVEGPCVCGLRHEGTFKAASSQDARCPRTLVATSLRSWST
jgi:hypothetical protein